MVVAPWQETQLRVVIEFKKGNKNVGRVIELAHRPDLLPPQLQGRVHPEAWRAFMQEVQALAQHHPYTARQNVGQCCWNLNMVFCFICIGFGIFDPDGGSHAQWQAEVANTLAHHQPVFAQGGCRLSLQQVHGSYFIQIDIDPNVAVGMAVAAPPPGGPYDPTKPSAGVSGGPPPGYGAPQGQPYYGQQAPPAGYSAPPQGYTQGPPQGYAQGQPQGYQPQGYEQGQPQGYQPQAPQYPNMK